jgi:hypothetical protein
VLATRGAPCHGLGSGHFAMPRAFHVITACAKYMEAINRDVCHSTRVPKLSTAEDGSTSPSIAPVPRPCRLRTPVARGNGSPANTARATYRTATRSRRASRRVRRPRTYLRGTARGASTRPTAARRASPRPPQTAPPLGSQSRGRLATPSHSIATTPTSDANAQGGRRPCRPRRGGAPIRSSPGPVAAFARVWAPPARKMGSPATTAHAKSPAGMSNSAGACGEQSPQGASSGIARRALPRGGRYASGRVSVNMGRATSLSATRSRYAGTEHGS